MSFKLEIENKHGKISIDLKRTVELEEHITIARVLDVVFKGEEEQEEETHYGPSLEDQIRSETTIAGKLQSRLGEHPVDSINMGSYKEPESGVRLKMLHFIDTGKVKAFKALRDATGMSVVGCKEIIYGNYPCPILEPEVAAKVMNAFREINFHVKAIPSEDFDAANIGGEARYWISGHR